MPVHITSRRHLGYAGISVIGNASATVINLANSWYLVNVFNTNLVNYNSTPDQSTGKITIGNNGDYYIGFTTAGTSGGTNKAFAYSVFSLSSTAVSVTAATQADPVVVTASGHGLSNGNKIAIKSVGGMTQLNNRIFTVQDISGATFELCDDGGASPANDIDGSGFTEYTSGGTIQKVTETRCYSQRMFSTADIGSFSSFTICSLNKNDTIEFYVKGITDTTDFTFNSINLVLNRLVN